MGQKIILTYTALGLLKWANLCVNHGNLVAAHVTACRTAILEPGVERRRNSMRGGTIFLPSMPVLIVKYKILARLAIAGATIAAAGAVPHGRNIPRRLAGKPARRATIRR
jgi:hypothetical protein